MGISDNRVECGATYDNRVLAAQVILLYGVGKRIGADFDVVGGAWRKFVKHVALL